MAWSCSQCRDDGPRERIQEALRTRVRRAAGRLASPSLGIVDSQSVKTTAAGGPGGVDTAKNIKGRKRHLLVDVLGLVFAVLVTAASVQDRDALPALVREGRAVAPRLTTVLVDAVYNGAVVEQASRASGITVEVVSREGPVRGFVPLPKRWIVERSFAWLGRDRRLAKDDERTIPSAETWIHVSTIGLMIRRLARKCPFRW